jgi:hypothetical protein
MIVNLLRAHDGSGQEMQQHIRVHFDFRDSGLHSLQRLSRVSGQVEAMSLTHDGGSHYHLDLILDGGTGDLFKYADGEPFVLSDLKWP